MLPPRSPGMAKVASVVREKTKKPTAASAVAPAAGTVPGMLGPASLDANRDAWANALSTMSGVNTPDPITAIAKVAGMGLAGYGQGKATKAKEAGSSAYRAKLAEALSGQPGNADLMGLMADPYADDASQRMLWNLYERNNPTQDEIQQRQLRDLQMQQAQLGMQQQQDEAARQQAIRGGQMDAVTGFMQQHEAAGGDLFSPEMQAGLRAQGVQGVDPADTRRYDAMQPYAQAGDFENAFQQYAAPQQATAATGPDWKETLLEDGVYWVDKANPANRVKIGERPERNEGEGREFTQEGKLRAEYEKAAKPFVDLRINYQKILASSQDNTGASDIAMVYSFMKMLDPTSVVREGEFATAENAGGVPTQIMTMYNRALTGERLAPEIRQQFLQQAGRQYEQQIQTYEQIRKQYAELATQYGVNPERVTPDISYGVEVQQEGTETPRVRRYNPETGRIE